MSWKWELVQSQTPSSQGRGIDKSGEQSAMTSVGDCAVLSAKQCWPCAFQGPCKSWTKPERLWSVGAPPSPMPSWPRPCAAPRAPPSSPGSTSTTTTPTPTTKTAPRPPGRHNTRAAPLPSISTARATGQVSPAAGVGACAGWNRRRGTQRPASDRCLFRHGPCTAGRGSPQLQFKSCALPSKCVREIDLFAHRRAWKWPLQQNLSFVLSEPL